jgi:hypothetical protein
MNEIPEGFCQCGCGRKTRIAKSSNFKQGHIKGQPYKYVSGHKSGIVNIKPLNVRLWKKVDIRDEDECWLWRGAINKNGYGVIGLGRAGSGNITVHRAAYIITFGGIPKDMFVCHNCPNGDTRSCCNPKHLFLGTPQDNMNDMIKKGRALHPKGSELPFSKLSESDVVEIFQQLKQGQAEQSIATERNVSVGCIRSIKKGKAWRHVTGLSR